MITIGKVIGGKYRVDGVVGAGGMGIVFAAMDLALHREVCLKFLLPALAADVAARERFAREARFASALRGEHVCHVYDVQALDDGTPYIIMERIDGHDLGVEVARRGALPIAEARALLRQACEGMAEAHASGVIHRDLKPHNLLLGRRLDGAPLLKIVDFGISKLAGDCATTAAAGSLAFGAPEQARRHRRIDARTDVYALGAILYYLVTGRPPFVSEDPLQLAVMVHTEVAPRPSTLRPELPSDLDAIIMRCLARRRERRYANASELAAALDGLETGEHPRAARPTRARYAILAAAAAVGLVAAIAEARGTETRADGMRPSISIAEPIGPDPEMKVRATVHDITVANRPAVAARSRGNATVAAAAPAVTSIPVADVAPKSMLAAPPPVAKPCRTDDFLCEFGSSR